MDIFCLELCKDIFIGFIQKERPDCTLQPQYLFVFTGKIKIPVMSQQSQFGSISKGEESIESARRFLNYTQANLIRKPNTAYKWTGLYCVPTVSNPQRDKPLIN